MSNFIKKNGVNYGLIIGVISIVFTTIMYIIDVRMFANFWLGLIIFFINLILGIIAVASTKKQLDGYISFKEAFSVYFFAMALGAAISMIFMYIMFNLVDPSAKEIIMDAAIEKTVEMMKGFGSKTEDIKNTVEQMEAVDNFSLISQIKSYFWSLLLYIIVGAIIAAALRRKKPEFGN